MKTETTILTAALIAAGVASSMAQNDVYSLNVVGCINITVHPGFNLISAPLQNADTSNNINSVLATANPVIDGDGSFVSTWNPAMQSFAPAVVAGGDGVWYSQNFIANIYYPIAPGQGFFLYNSGSDSTISVVGSVVNNSSNTITPGFNFYGNILPVIEDVANNGFPVVTDSFVQTFSGIEYNPALLGVSAADNGTSNPAFYNAGFQAVVPFTPGVGQGFLYFNPGAAATWNQTFAVGP